MVHAALRLCKKMGCSNLVVKGYCNKHAPIAEQETKERFTTLNTKKTPEQRAFYSSAEWTATSRAHRINEPLCRRCKAQGIIRAATLTHHNPPLQYLLSNNLSPYKDEYLESLCLSCHQKELYAKHNNKTA